MMTRAGSRLPRVCFVAVLVFFSACSPERRAAETGPPRSAFQDGWDLESLGLFDRTNSTYRIENESLTVDLGARRGLCPSGLGDIAHNQQFLMKLTLVYDMDEAGDYWLHVFWNPGESGVERFEVLANGRSVGYTSIVDTAKEPLKDVVDSFSVPQRRGQNSITFRYASNDGMRFADIVLSESAVPPPVDESLAYGEIRRPSSGTSQEQRRTAPLNWRRQLNPQQR